MLLSQFLLTFQQTQNGMSRFTAQLMAILVLIKMVISEMLHGKISLNSALLLLLENFVKKIS